MPMLPHCSGWGAEDTEKEKGLRLAYRPTHCNAWDAEDKRKREGLKTSVQAHALRKRPASTIEHCSAHATHFWDFFYRNLNVLTRIKIFLNLIFEELDFRGTKHMLGAIARVRFIKVSSLNLF